MREIKFRAWDKRLKRMVYEGWAIRFKPLLKYQSGVIIEDDGDGIEECYGEWNDNEKIIVMQSTGLKDRNGKEVFEGDVVLVKAEGTWKDMYYKIGFHMGCFVAMDIGTANIHCHYPNEFNFNACEIIGNIHQNPELLKDS